MKNNKIKKIFGRTLSVILTIFLLVGAIPIAEVSAAEDTSNFEYYLKDDNTATITSYTGNDVNVVIPQYIDGYPVTSIEHYTFFYKKSIESIYIPNSVLQLDAPNEEGYLFRGNGALKNINVSEDNPVYSSENGILYNKDKTKLLAYPMNKIGTEFEVPDYVKEIGTFAFYYNGNLEEISFEGKIDIIDEIAISELRSLKNFYYPARANVESAILTDCQFSHIDVYISKEISAMNDRDFIGSDVTLHVYNNSYALEWAKEHEYEYEIMEEEPIEKELIDTNTGIKVEGTMDPDANLNVEKVEGTVEDAVATYDITLRKDGDVIQPSGTITISIPSEIKDCKLFWVKDDGTKVEVNAKYENGKYVFTTDHLSVYALVKEPEPTTVAPPETTVTEPIETTVPEPTVTEPIETTVPEPTVTEPIETTVPVPTATEPIETTVPEPTATEPIETTVPEPTVTEPIETTVPEPTATEPIETTVPVPTVTEQVETTVAPPETTVESATDKVEPTKSVATPDTPNNNSNSGSNSNSNSGSSSGSSSASINNSSIVATGDMLGASNLLLLSIIIMSATTGVSVILFRRKKEKVSNK